VQGGGIFINGYAPHFQITNNLIQSNGGTYGGAIRLGWAHIQNMGPEDGSRWSRAATNRGRRIAHNRIVANGGTNLAGAIALFNGADNYEIAYNDICGNSSVEYGGGISHYGLSPGGRSTTTASTTTAPTMKAAAIMIAGELPATFPEPFPKGQARSTSSTT
jgi:large repetitive protein